MILSTHAVVGGAIASLMPGHPVLAFGIGVASHFAIDAIRMSTIRFTRLPLSEAHHLR